MRWGAWVGACVLSTCVGQPRMPACQDASDLAPCQAQADVRACLDPDAEPLPSIAERCERAWQRTRSEPAAVTGARIALALRDDAALMRWEQRARWTVEGARIFRYVSDMQRRHGDLAGAEESLRKALQLQLDRDPARASNTAVSLLELVQSNEPARESIRLATIAWQQARLARVALSQAYAANALVDILVDLGELSTAAAVVDRMEAGGPPISDALVAGAKARLEAARGRRRTSIELFRRASRPGRDDPGGLEPMKDTIGLILALVEDGRTAEARRELDHASVGKDPLRSLDIDCRLAAAQASVELAEGDIAAALATVERGLAIRSRDAARVQLLDVRGDALARRGDLRAAEQAWRAAADLIEDWRASIPASELRQGLVARHRRALESWLDSTGQRGDAEGAFKVMERLVGRELLDRIRQREANAPATVEESVRDVEQRLVAWDRSVATVPLHRAHDPRELDRDMIAIVFGARWGWALRHVHGRWSIARVGERPAIVRLVDAYRRAIDDPDAAEALGVALFPASSLPALGAPLMVMLDHELSDIPLSGLRIAGKYLIERVAIIEVLAPDLLFAPVPQRAWGRAVAVGDPMGDLRGATREVEAIRRMMDARAYRGAQATSEVVRDGRAARLLHVATHSKIDEGRAAFVLSDRVVSASEIVDEGIAPRLAVIASCRSQVDDDPSGSLVAAFLAAGSPGVIGVKHAYEDLAGSAPMLEFYRRFRLSGNRAPWQALALAQRAAIAARRPARAWAPLSFFGVGGWVH